MSEDEPRSEPSENESLSGPTYQRRYQEQISREVAEADQEWIRKQKFLDHWWQTKLDDEALLDDGYVEIAGFREPRYRTTCHVGKHDPDFGQH